MHKEKEKHRECTEAGLFRKDSRKSLCLSRGEDEEETAEEYAIGND